MSGDEPHTPHAKSTTDNGAHMPPPTSSDDQVLDELANYLEDSFRITDDADSYKNRRRFIQLKADELYTALVIIYTHMFNSNWMHFKRVNESFKKFLESAEYNLTKEPAATTSSTKDTTADNLRALPEHPLYMAKVYISHWILDVYRSIREACPDLSGLAFQSRFMQPQDEQSPIYDVFLATLNAHIRPTPITGILEDALFIPHFHAGTKEVFADANNPFNIKRFTLNADYFRNIIFCISDKRSGWTTKPKSPSLVGRPSWLFDWPANTNMCAWFPMEQNYTVEDCTVAYIVGVACTSKLAPRDFDDIQFWPNNQMPSSFRKSELTRIRPLSKEAGYIYREIDTDMHFDKDIKNPYLYLSDNAGITTKRRRRDTGTVSSALIISGRKTTDLEVDNMVTQIEQDPSFLYTVNCYRITDFLYYSRIITKLSDQQRYLILSNILHEALQH